MPVYIGLLRAIGPVTHAKMSMAALREQCEAAGFRDVATVLNTGNLLLRSEHSATEARELVQKVVDGFGINSEVFLRTPWQLAELVEANPFPAAAEHHPSAVGVCFFQRTPEWPASIGHYDGPEDLAPVTSHLVVDYKGRMSGSKINVEKRLGMTMTQRNWTTVMTLARRAAAIH